MASVTFPQSSNSISSSYHDSFYSSSSPYDEPSAFQMNPLSAHPPRNPRASLTTANSHVYGTSAYDTEDDIKERTGQFSEVNDEIQSEASLALAKSTVRSEDVWREIVLTSNGRDKVFKLLQYSIRLYLFCHFSLGATTYLRKYKRPPWEAEVVKRLQSTMGGLSFSRKLLIMFNWLNPLTTIMAQQSASYSTELALHTGSKPPRRKPLLQALLYAPPPVLLDLLNCIADDVYTLSRLGAISKETGERAGKFADWCWFISTLVGLVENGLERSVLSTLKREVQNRAYEDALAGSTLKSAPTSTKYDEEELKKLRKQDYWLQISRAKLLMDLVFVSYDVFKFKKAAEPVKATTGLLAAILSTSKLFDRHWNLLAKSS